MSDPIAQTENATAQPAAMAAAPQHAAMSGSQSGPVAPGASRQSEALEAQAGPTGSGANSLPPRQAAPLWAAVGLTLARDLRLAFRKRGQLVQPLVFFAIVTTLFPLGISPELSRLRDVAYHVSTKRDLKEKTCPDKSH